MTINPDDPIDDQAGKVIIIAGIKKSDNRPYPLKVTNDGELIVDAEFTGDVVVDIDLPESTNGKSLTLTGGVSDQLPTLALKAGMVIQADDNNTNDVWVGGSGVAINDGFKLGPGESVPITTENQDTVYVIGTAGEKVHYLSG